MSDYKKFEMSDNLSDRKKHHKEGIKGLHHKSDAVRIRVKDILSYIKDHNLKEDDKLVFHFVAYKEEDYENYKKKHWVEQMPEKKDFVNRQTIALSAHPANLRNKAFDVGELCPPPDGACDMSNSQVG